MLNPATEQRLRQFARALLADRTLGDELMQTAVRRMPERAEAADRVALFRAFLHAWRELGEANSGRPFSGASLSHALPKPPPEARLVLILVDVMGFDMTDAGAVIGSDEHAARQLLHEGRQWAGGPFEGSALIIEDEPLIAAELRGILEQSGVNVVGTARAAHQAVDLAARLEPDLLLADYNLDGVETGIDAVHEIQERIASPVVFITGYPERVLAGDDVEPDFVLVKPYTVLAVRAAVAICLSTDRPTVAQ